MTRGCKASGVNKIRIHDIRHSHASLLIELGFSPLLVSERLGHENVETTLQSYSHIYPNKHRDVANKLDDISEPPRAEKNDQNTSEIDEKLDNLK